MPWLFGRRPDPAPARTANGGVARWAAARPERPPRRQHGAVSREQLSEAVTDLFLTVCEGDEAGVQRVLDLRPELLHLRTSQFGLGGKDSTPLHLAASYGHVAVVKTLAERGADLLDRDEDGDTAFNCAVRAAQWGVADYLASVGAVRLENLQDQSCLLSYEEHTRKASTAERAEAAIPGIASGPRSATASDGISFGKALGQQIRSWLARLPLRAARRIAAPAAAGVTLLALVSSAGLVAPRSLASNPVSMPKLTGSLESAVLRAAPLELRLQVMGEEHATEPRGTVLRQQPAPGERIAKGGTARIWVSLGPVAAAASPDQLQPLRVPDGVERPVASAKEMVAQMGPPRSVDEYEPNKLHPDGTVARQTPPAGSPAGTPSQAKAVVSRGWRTRVPAVAGLVQSAATRRLQEAGLSAAVASRPDGRFPRGQAVRSIPPAGTLVQPGWRVTLIISAGAPPAPIPRTGTLSVSADSAGCQVWVYADGGSPLGKCPLTAQLTPGSHVITFWDTSHEPGIQKDVRVGIVAGEVTKLQRRLH